MKKNLSVLVVCVITMLALFATASAEVSVQTASTKNNQPLTDSAVIINYVVNESSDDIELQIVSGVKGSRVSYLIEGEPAEVIEYIQSDSAMIERFAQLTDAHAAVMSAAYKDIVIKTYDRWEDCFEEIKLIDSKLMFMAYLVTATK